MTRSLHYDESKTDALYDRHVRELRDEREGFRDFPPAIDIPLENLAAAVAMGILLWAAIIGGGWIIVECVMHRWFQ